MLLFIASVGLASKQSPMAEKSPAILWPAKIYNKSILFVNDFYSVTAKNWIGEKATISTSYNGGILAPKISKRFRN